MVAGHTERREWNTHMTRWGTYHCTAHTESQQVDSDTGDTYTAHYYAAHEVKVLAPR
jgi:hypothetical protein